VAELAKEELRVSTLECFFDLVFVFAVTQLTSVLGHEPNGAGLAKMALLLGAIWWMYGGYAWLTNVVAPVTPARRALLGLGVPYLRGTPQIPLRPAHFVERHGLVLLIAFGESVAAIGAGIVGERLSVGLILAAVLTLGVLLALWWSYFGGEDQLAEKRLLKAEVGRRAALALHAYGRAFYLLLAGIIVLAAGVKQAIGEPWRPGQPAEVIAIAGGVVVYLMGDLVLRRTLRLGPWLPRCVAAVLVAATVGVGLAVSMIVQLVSIAVVLACAFALEREDQREDPSPWRRRRRAA
jgi:low temperature requirement protein LtrA